MRAPISRTFLLGWESADKLRVPPSRSSDAASQPTDRRQHGSAFRRIRGRLDQAVDSKISHADIVAFADNRVNLRREDMNAHREQVGRLRAKLETYIAAHPGFDLVKMLRSGSVANGTALKTINDMDVAVYVKAGRAPGSETAS